MLPKNIYLIRHGLSEGNVVIKLLRAGRADEVPPEFSKRLTHEWRLTSKGVEQAKSAGAWMRANVVGPIEQSMVSSYTRAEETAGYVNPDARWFVEPYLRERNWGTVDALPPMERVAIMAKLEEEQDRDPFHWSPPGGDSMADILGHTKAVNDKLWSDCGHMENVELCLHGEKMWAFVIRYTKMRVSEFERLHRSGNPHDKINNCQILQFTRQNPFEAEPPRPHLGWWRSICPWDESKSNPAWRTIARPAPTGRELLAEVERFPRLVDA
jgi:broad specificity phosphatase PhoE